MKDKTFLAEAMKVCLSIDPAKSQAGKTQSDHRYEVSITVGFNSCFGVGWPASGCSFKTKLSSRPSDARAGTHDTARSHGSRIIACPGLEPGAGITKEFWQDRPMRVQQRQFKTNPHTNVQTSVSDLPCRSPCMTPSASICLAAGNAARLSPRTWRFRK